MKLVYYFISLFAVLQTVSAVTYCNTTQACPESTPCCSLTGVCGTGQYCLGSCNPKFSFNADSCMPVPVCKNSNTKFDRYSSKLLDSNTYLGNVSSADWTYSGYAMNYDDEDSLILAMPKDTTGSLLSHTRYMWYGKVSVRLKTSHLAGVITAFIMYSQVQDEIDFEFVGVDLKTAQTNFYWQGVLNYTNSANISTTDTFSEFHTYEIDWQEDYTTWAIDGVIGRTLYKNSTYNATTGIYQYPQTPSRIQLSIWPGGSPSNAQGTIEWAGGEIDWDASDLTDPGYYYMILKEVNVTCYDPPSGTKKTGTSSYKYSSDNSFLAKDVAIVDADMILGSDEGTGLDPTKGASSSSSISRTKSSSKSSSSGLAKTSSDSSSIKTGNPNSSTTTSETNEFVQNTSSRSSGAGVTTFKVNSWLTLVFNIIIVYIL